LQNPIFPPTKPNKNWASQICEPLGAVPFHSFPYRWTLKDANFTKDKGKVFSCFACGGGSTMGYKLAGFDVLGCNEIDPKMIEAYKANHNPKYAYLEPIQTFKLRTDLPDELYNLDILDGSPPSQSTIRYIQCPHRFVERLAVTFFFFSLFFAPPFKYKRMRN